MTPRGESTKPCFEASLRPRVARPQAVIDAENVGADSMDYEGCCRHTNKATGHSGIWWCTRKQGHRGWHVAHGGSMVMAWWAQEYPERVALPEGI